MGIAREGLENGWMLPEKALLLLNVLLASLLGRYVGSDTFLFFYVALSRLHLPST